MIKLRDYQESIVNALRSEVEYGKKILVHAPTGAGKTKISQFIIERIISSGKKCLFTTPRIKLSIQTQESFGFGNLILGSKTQDNGSNCTIASVQSLYSRKVTQHFDFIFIDECHFAHGSKYIDYIMETYRNSVIIGLSATPIDENGYLLSGYDSIISEVSVKDLIKKGYLTDVEVYSSNVQPDFSEVPIVNGDYNQEQASKVLKEQKVLSNTMEEWERLAKNLKTIVFSSSIDHCEELLREFKDRNVTACSVHSKMSEKDIEKAYMDFNKDKCQVLINVDMATFGFDEPSIECMLFARGIKSLRLYKQMVGRGIRIYEGKEKCLMIDCANVIVDNGYPTDPMPFIKKPIVNETVDRMARVERDTDGSINEEEDLERIDYLKKIGSLVDLYKDKVYTKEQDLVDDCKKILKRAGYFMWRQNSGKLFKEGRWVHFTDKNGLPDITLVYKGVYIGLELKLPKGRLTKYQQVTLPELSYNGIQYFIIQNVIDLFEVLEKVRANIVDHEDGVIIKDGLKELSETQIRYRDKYKLSKLH